VVDAAFVGGVMDLSKIHYDPHTGLLTWAINAPGIRAGKRAGCVGAGGYWTVRLNRKQYRAHRLIWRIVHGEWPIGEIDHINGNPLDNRIWNLRVVDRATNAQNMRGAHRNNKSSGLLGVTWNKQHKKWQSKIMVNKNFHHVGLFDSAEDAHAAYLAKKRQLHAGCTI
jgi:hypothetical protein